MVSLESYDILADSSHQMANQGISDSKVGPMGYRGSFSQAFISTTHLQYLLCAIPVLTAGVEVVKVMSFILIPGELPV